MQELLKRLLLVVKVVLLVMGVMSDGDGVMFQILLLQTAEAFNKAAYVSDVAYSSVFDASYIKLREIKFGYTFKNTWANSLSRTSTSLLLEETWQF